MIRSTWNTLRFWQFTLLHFCGEYLLSRPWQLLVLALPAVAVLVGLAIVVRESSLTPLAQRATRYRTLATAAAKAGDLTAAERWYRKALAFDPADAPTQFAHAQLLYRREVSQRAIAIMRELAPATGGYAPAHLWLAESALAQSPPDTSTAITQLQLALQQSPDDRSARLLLVDLLYRQQQYRTAHNVLAPIADQEPELQLALARIQLFLGEAENAAATAQAAARALAAELRLRPENDEAAQLQIQSLIYAMDFAAAENLARSRLTAADNPANRTVLASVLTFRVAEVRRGQPDQLRPRWQLLAEIVGLGPQSAHTRLEVAHFLAQASQDASFTADELALLRDDDADSAIANLLLGSRAADLGLVAQSLPFLEAAVRKSPQSPVALNNLACALAASVPPDLDRALELANSAVLLSQQHPETIETRGQIYAQQGAWQAAIDDLELAATRLPPRPQIHASLARAYAGLGNETTAAGHRQRAAELSTPPDSPNEPPSAPQGRTAK